MTVFPIEEVEKPPEKRHRHKQDKDVKGWDTETSGEVQLETRLQMAPKYLSGGVGPPFLFKAKNKLLLLYFRKMRNKHRSCSCVLQYKS